MADEHQRLMNRLDQPMLQQVAIRKMEGYTNQEIATELGVTQRSIERKLNRIRLIWSGEVS